MKQSNGGLRMQNDFLQNNSEDTAYVSTETVIKAMQGDKDAFSALFRQTYTAMYFAAKKYLHEDEDIYDALQTGYLKAYRYISRLQAPEAFFNWLKKTIENASKTILSEKIEQADYTEAVYDAVAEPPDEDAYILERKSDVRDTLEKMDPKQAEVLKLYYYDNMRLSEIAVLLNEPKSTVRSRFSAAKKTITALLRTKGIDKSMYSGSMTAMIAVSLRSVIGTEVLSAAKAQQMLDDILTGHHGQLGAAAYQLLLKRRNRQVLKAVSWLMALTVAVSSLSAVLVTHFSKQSSRNSAFAASAVGSESNPADSGSSPAASADKAGASISADPNSASRGSASQPTSSGILQQFTNSSSPFVPIGDSSQTSHISSQTNPVEGTASGSPSSSATTSSGKSSAGSESKSPASASSSPSSSGSGSKSSSVTSSATYPQTPPDSLP